MGAANSQRNEKGQFVIGNYASAKKWKSPEELQEAIDVYYLECETNEVHTSKDGTKIFEPYTIEGLALVLDCDMDTLLNYEKKEGYEPYFGTIKRAKLKIQKQKLVNGYVGLSNSTLTIFDLKNNHGYKDKTETDVTSKGNELGMPVSSWVNGSDKGSEDMDEFDPNEPED
tara:strand:+ start:715 stop:1227 length:513 start_codon:yes stop_codon:yes gene_type:complete